MDRITDGTGPLPVTLEKHYIAGVAVVTRDVSSGPSDTEYLHADHLGSTETITDANGAVRQHMSLDARSHPPRASAASSTPPP